MAPMPVPWTVCPACASAWPRPAHRMPLRYLTGNTPRRFLAIGWSFGLLLALADCQPQVVESYGFGGQIAKPALGVEADVMKLATWTLGLSSKRCSGALAVECGMSLFAASNERRLCAIGNLR